MSFDPEQITFFAQTDARGQNVPFGIKAKDRTRHVYVIGKTGMGKSTLLENMAIQDIKNGNGLAFIDPHGQTAETLLDYIPESRKDDVLYFAPFDMDNPVSFNVMEDVGPDRRHLVVSGLMSVFKKIWVDAWSARMEYILSNTLLALLEYPGSTLLGVNRMLSDKNYRKKVVDNIKDPSVRSFWVDEFAKYNERYMQEAGDAIKNKIGQFTANPLIRNIVGQPKSSFDIREMMDKKKILIMNLSKGLVGESNANLLGSMLTTRIYLAAMSRADMTQEAMKAAPNFYFYVDEFQSFANATFANILSEARKYKLNLTIAHQYIEQMEEEVRDAVFGNVGTIIAFRVGPFDAEVLETIFTPKFLAPDIVNLGFAQVYLTLMIDGIGSQPFSATTLPPIKPALISYKNVIINRSRQQFSHPRVEVEKAIYEWHGITETGAPLKSETSSAPKVVQNETPKTPVRTERSVAPSGERTTTSKENYGTRERTERAVYETREVSKNERESKRAEPEKNVKPAPSVTAPENRQRNNNGQSPRKERTEAPKGNKNLEDLRAILRTISTKESIGSTSQSHEKKTVTQEVPVVKNHAPQEPQEKSLREALGSVINVVTEKKEEKVSVTMKESTNVETVSKERVESQLQTNLQSKPDEVPVSQPAQIPETTVPTKSVEHEVREYAEKKNIDDPLSPKKLERMMRVTTNDKTPLG